MKLELIRNRREIPSVAAFIGIRDLYMHTVLKRKTDIGIDEINEVAYPTLSVT